MLKIANALIAIVGGVAGSLLLYWLMNKVVERLPGKWEERLKPIVFIGPAVLVISLFLIYPAIRTFVLSFANSTSTEFVGIVNYTDLLSSPDFRSTMFNTVLWVAIVPAFTVVFGLGVAVLADRLKERGEKLSKSIIFLPMAISLVAASTAWRFIYDYQPPGEPQIGLQNALVTGLGFEPVQWLQLETARINSLLLMVILIWAQVGFAMVLLSAAVKSVPSDTLEAARIDGANERQAFFRVVVPQIWPTVVTVFITVLIGVLKAFDIVYVMTGGNFNTDVVAVRFYTELFTNGQNGRAAAIVVMLVLVMIPIMIYQVRQFRAQEAQR
jgi:alpha-glucoside transport system permease protein